jgi:hypothetical protein
MLHRDTLIVDHSDDTERQRALSDPEAHCPFGLPLKSDPLKSGRRCHVS